MFYKLTEPDGKSIGIEDKSSFAKEAGRNFVLKVFSEAGLPLVRDHEESTPEIFSLETKARIERMGSLIRDLAEFVSEHRHQEGAAELLKRCETLT